MIFQAQKGPACESSNARRFVFDADYEYIGALHWPSPRHTEFSTKEFVAAGIFLLL